MAQDPAQLRSQIDRQRTEISGTIDQIENRVNPSHVLARRQDRMKRRLTDWKDTVFGNDEPDYPVSRNRYAASSSSTSDQGLGDRLGDAASSASASVQHAPDALRRQARGNPMAAGAIALGAGWLIASLLPETQQERTAIRRVEPQLSDAATAVKAEAQGMTDDLKEPVRQATDEVKQVGKDAAGGIKEQGGQAAAEVKDQVES